jgi:ComF family protein
MRLFSRLLLFLFPKYCPFCQSTIGLNAHYCIECEESIPWLTDACQQCAYPLPKNPDSLLICGECLTKTPAFDLTIAAIHYHPIIQHMVVSFKFSHAFYYTEFFSSLMTHTIRQKISKKQLDLPEYIIPMPLHKKRLRKRGFNQSLEIAKYFSKALACPIDHALVKRNRSTKPQVGLSKSERQKNLKHAFSVNPNDYSHIAIFDDVMTTGASANALAKALKDSGIKRVDVWCLARATLKK